MSDIRKNLIRHVAALDLLGGEIRSLSKWGPARKLTDEEHRIASMAAGEARRVVMNLAPYGFGEPVEIRPDWRDYMTPPDLLIGDAVVLCKVIGEHGLGVLHDRKKLAGYARILREK